MYRVMHSWHCKVAASRCFFVCLPTRRRQLFALDRCCASCCESSCGCTQCLGCQEAMYGCAMQTAMWGGIAVSGFLETWFTRYLSSCCRGYFMPGSQLTFDKRSAGCACVARLTSLVHAHMQLPMSNQVCSTALLYVSRRDERLQKAFVEVVLCCECCSEGSVKLSMPSHCSTHPEWAAVQNFVMQLVLMTHPTPPQNHVQGMRRLHS